MGESTRGKWAERFRASGLKLGEFSKKTGVNVHSLKWWSWRLKSVAAQRPRTAAIVKREPRNLASRAQAKGEKVDLGPLTFVEMTAAVEVDRLEVVLPTSVRVRVRPGFDGATLCRLLDVLDAKK